MELEILLHKYFKNFIFRAYQKEVIKSVLNGDDVFVRFPTGMGKSLCYQLPALMMPGCAIVISPLIALMKDQVDSLTQRGISAVYLNSSLSPCKYQQIKEDCINNRYKIIYLSPEGLLKELESFICKINVSLFAIDEVHTIMDWGFDFRPHYAQLKVLKKLFPKIPIIALTASVTTQSKSEIQNILGIENAKIFSAPLYRSNISLSVKNNLKEQNKIYEIIKLCNKYKHCPGIVYCNTRRTANSIANKLKHRGFNALSYHAGMTGKERNLVQQSFFDSKVDIVCATIAFGMGIDKSDIRWIVHYNIPQSIETYYQEIGRAGRDGLNSEALLLFNDDDTELIETFALRSGNTDINLNKLQILKSYVNSKICRWQFIINYFGENEDLSNCNCDICSST